ncbi:hypothetical protein [Krasilnikovia sp. MM14-A1004]|uniref:hypothetical protein n=1 Tax=Krasilnikovia sp. MM14-A1004 TaxID=3373541 RepID=UPI00399D01DA
MKTRKPIVVALLLAPLVAITGCTEVPKSKQTLKKHTITYKVSHSMAGEPLEIEYGYETKKGKQYKYESGTSAHTWHKKRKTKKQRITYVRMDVTSNDIDDRVTCEIVFDGKTLVRKSDTYFVSC